MKTDYNTENLEKISEIFFSIANQTGQLIFDGDAKTGKIGWYGAIEEFTGYTPEEFSKVDLEACKGLVHPEDLGRVWVPWRNLYKLGKNLSKNLGLRERTIIVM